MQLKKVGLFAAVTATLGGCATNPQTGNLEISPSIQNGIASVKNKVVDIYDSPDPCANNDRNIGVTVGALAGAILGHEMKNDKSGTLVGALLGAGVGGLIGHNMDTRRCALYKIATANDLKLASATITDSKLGVTNAASNTAVGLDVMVQNKTDEFDPGSAIITPQARVYLSQIANQYSPRALIASLGPNPTPEAIEQMQERKVLIVAHAAETEDPTRAARLSQERALAVAQVFEESGVPAKNIYYQGAGDTLPIASNIDDAGRAENRRVQIVDVPTEVDLARYLQHRAPNPVYFSEATTQPASPQAAGQSTLDSGFKQQTSQAQSSESEKQRPLVSEQKAPVVSRHRETVASRLHKAPQIRPSYVPISGYNFGGQPVPTSGERIYLGAAAPHSNFNIIAPAQADTPIFIQSCLNQKPLVSTVVRNLATGDELAPRNFVHGFFGTVWIGNANGNLLAITDATIPLDAGAPVPSPKVLIYKNYRGDRKQRPSFEARAPVNVYRGADRMVYRIFVKGPAQCIDLVVPTSKFTGGANLYYAQAGSEYLAKPTFAMVK